MGIDDVSEAYNAMIGAWVSKLEKPLAGSYVLTMIPKILFAAATIALPVPRSLVGNSSGESA